MSRPQAATTPLTTPILTNFRINVNTKKQCFTKRIKKFTIYTLLPVFCRTNLTVPPLGGGCQRQLTGGECSTNVKNLRDISVGNGLRAVPQHRIPGFLTGSANTEIVYFGPRGPKYTGRHADRPLQIRLKFLIFCRPPPPLGRRRTANSVFLR